MSQVNSFSTPLPAALWWRARGAEPRGSSAVMLPLADPSPHHQGCFYVAPKERLEQRLEGFHSDRNQLIDHKKPGRQFLLCLITSRLNLCNSLLLCYSKDVLIQNTAARLLAGTRMRRHISPILASRHWLPVRFRI